MENEWRSFPLPIRALFIISDAKKRIFLKLSEVRKWCVKIKHSNEPTLSFLFPAIKAPIQNRDFAYFFGNIFFRRNTILFSN